MGVRGLTTFIAKNSDKYLRPYELHDTYLVIDGNNLSFQLYRWHCKCYDCFGGDYDRFAQVVVDFFDSLKRCKITPLVVFDGGYENRKLKTIFSRVKTRIRNAQILDSTTEGSVTVFPLFIRELFCEIVLKLEVKAVRCLVEADAEMACISRKLQCPVLSYDSDFYIFNVQYIPFNGMELSVRKGRGYNYLECKIYKVENFLEHYPGLQKDCVPLLGVLLGNDYISIGVFKDFYAQLKILKSKSNNEQQKRIKSLIAWLQNETFESAVRKVLSRTKQGNRAKITEQISSAARDYVCAKSEFFSFFDVEVSENAEITPEVILDVSDVEDVEGEASSDDEGENDEDFEIEELLEDGMESCSNYLKLPEYVKDQFIRCKYPASTIDIIFHNCYIFIPIIEDFTEAQCHNISIKILSAIANLLKEQPTRITYILRNENGRMGRYILPDSSVKLPSIGELGKNSKSESLMLIQAALEVDRNLLNLLNKFPSSWRLYAISVIYWIRHTDKINNCYIYALLLTGVLIKSFGNFPRNQTKFKQAYKKDIERIGTNKIPPLTQSTIKAILNSISKDEKIIAMKEFIGNFDMNLKMRSKRKLFDRGIVHVFAQFQSCAYYIKYLNVLLDRPYEDYLISDFYNGTMIYNLMVNFKSRPQLDLYVKSMLSRTPNIYTCFAMIADVVKGYFEDRCFTNDDIKRRKRRRKKKNDDVEIIEEDVYVDQTDEEEFDDLNNHYTALNLLRR